ncbi:MAG: hypothetical protein ACOY3I_01470 [Verrucomicrobiota bacterium]
MKFFRKIRQIKRRKALEKTIRALKISEIHIGSHPHALDDPNFSVAILQPDVDNLGPYPHAFDDPQNTTYPIFEPDVKTSFPSKVWSKVRHALGIPRVHGSC